MKDDAKKIDMNEYDEYLEFKSYVNDQITDIRVKLKELEDKLAAIEQKKLITK